MEIGTKRTASIAIVTLALAIGGLSGCSDDTDSSTSSSSSAVTSSPAEDEAAVLEQEARWLKAITAGDRDTIEAILAPNFRHITSDGTLLDRSAEIDTIVPVQFTMNPTEQIVDIVGDTAVIHGVNTLLQDGNVLARERFTDVFVRVDGEWLALAAQETTYPPAG